MRKSIFLGLLLAIGFFGFIPEASATIFEKTVKILETRYYDRNFREKALPDIVARYREQAKAAKTEREQREITHALLSNVPSSHLGLLSRTALNRMMGDLRNDTGPTFGFDLVELDGKYFATNVLEGGPGEKTKILRGDRIVTIDGVLPEESERLDWRTDDAYLADNPAHFLLGKVGDTIQLYIERTPGNFLSLTASAETYSAFEAFKHSARIVKQGDKKIGIIHPWYIHFTGVDTLIKKKLEGDFADCDAFILDLRGRGGNAAMVERILQVVAGKTSKWKKPNVALINNVSRSAKDVIAYELKERKIALLVGEPTAGAVIPASMLEVGEETYLMFPSFTLGEYTTKLEFSPVPPDVHISEPGPYSEGRDPILERGLIEAARLSEKKQY